MGEMTLTDADMAELREAFFSQAGEILDNLNSYIMAIEKDPVEDNWKALKRAFHTLKGDSKAMGFHSLSTFAHKVEDLIAALKDAEPEKASFDLLLGCADAFGTFVETVSGGGEPDIAAVMSRIDAHIRSRGAHGEKSEKAVARNTSGRGAALLKIEPERVDRIMNLVGELVIGRSMLSQINSEIDTLRRETIASRLYNLNSSFERTLSELQRSVMKVRMLPVDVVFRRFPRIVRDLSAEKGKLAALITEGETTELDKGIVDVIGEPLMHIIRNAVDHGIEPPAERKLAGKPEEGLIRLRAFHQGNQMVIEVEDDGGGIDIELLKQKAVSNTILSEDESKKMGGQDALNLIFLSGLSTAATITEVSGRGVGMDIVRETVESLRGVIDIASEKGRGTKFTIRLPLTLAIIKSILFMHKDEIFALPMTSVTEIKRVFPEEMDSIGGRPVLRHRGSVVPLISLDEETPGSDKLFIIFVGVGHVRAGIMTERILGEEELVIKALDGKAGSGMASGASILGNGSVVLILDPLSLIKKYSARRDDIMPAGEAVHENISI
ncbi:MAG: chemotaxis protein CheA [Thermodesulfovibrionales bacterium]